VKEVKKVQVLTLLDGATVVGCNSYELDGRIQLDFPALVTMDDTHSIYLTMMFGKPERISVEAKSILYQYEINNKEIVKAYTNTVIKSITKAVEIGQFNA